jgi:hypothetical protein
MGPDYRMLILHGFPSDNTSTLQAKLRLFKAGMHSFEAMEKLLDRWRKTIIGFNLVHENGITADLGAVKNVQKCGAGWLLLISHIRMPGDTAVGILILESVVVVSVDEMNFWKTFR